MEICSAAFLTIAIVITVLTNKYRTKNSLLWQNIGDIVVRGYRGYREWNIGYGTMVSGYPCRRFAMVRISDNGPGWK